MSKKKKGSAEEAVLALMGNKWIQVYGENINNLHFHNLIEIGYCHYGAGELVIEEDQYRFGAGMVSCIPANFLHVTKSDTHVRAFWEYLYISPADILKQQGKPMQETRNIIDAVNRSAFFIKVEENPIFVTLIRAIFEEMQNKNAYYRECVGGLAYTLLYEIARFNGRGNVQSCGKNNSLQLENAIEYVERNYPNNFKIADLANECHMSETHFRRVFQEKMNMTPVAATEPMPLEPVIILPMLLKFATKSITPGAFSGSVTKNPQAMMPVTTGTAMRATRGDAFLVMMRTSISTTVRKPKNANIEFSSSFFSFSLWADMYRGVIRPGNGTSCAAATLRR